MRLLGALVVGLIMYFAVPLLWQRAMVHRVAEIEKGPPPFPISATVRAPAADTSNMINAMQPEINEAEINDMEQIGARAAADEAMQRAQAAQDQAWRASHGQMP
jgi:hypothetical protein